MTIELPDNPAAERNKEPILNVLRDILPRKGLVLEIASGTGQHVVHFAKELPELNWQPTDKDEASTDSIMVRVRESGLDNIIKPILLDVRHIPWPIDHSDAILCINMIHISPWAATEALFTNANQALSSSGILYLYGPYRQSGRHNSATNESFDISLQSRNPEWGVRDLEAIVELAKAQGFSLENATEMPANNLSVAFRNTS